jgi:exosortase F-associated protein
MLKNLFKYKFDILLIAIFVFALACIRAFENELFYDPFLDYFKSDYQNIKMPEIHNINLFLGFFLRFLLNSILSILIIYVIFKDFEIIKFSIILYLLFFVILITSFFVLLNHPISNIKMYLFYIRRFIIQPILLLLFIPGLYFQKTTKI